MESFWGLMKVILFKFVIFFISVLLRMCKKVILFFLILKKLKKIFYF